MNNELVIRQAVSRDAAAFLELWDALDSETEFMLYEPGERQASVDGQADWLGRAESSENIRILVAVAQDRESGRWHAATILGQGSRTRLIKALEQWTLGHHIQRLELNVMTNNHPAIALYRKCGFEIEGTKRKSVQLESGLRDEYQMGKLLAFTA